VDDLSRDEIAYGQENRGAAKIVQGTRPAKALIGDSPFEKFRRQVALRRPRGD